MRRSWYWGTATSFRERWKITATKCRLHRPAPSLAHCLETMSGREILKASDATEYGGISGLTVAWLGDWAGAIPVGDGIPPLCHEAL
jgi:hypothetical protein